MAAQEEAVDKASDDAERRLPFECVAHGGYTVVKLEFVKVAQPFERASNHLVVKTMRAVKRGDPRDEALLDAKVAALEGDQVAKFEQPFGTPRRDDAFRRKRRRFAVGVYVASEVETEFDGRADFCFDDDGSHECHEDFAELEGTLDK
ncbi:MAG: hypothetical protein ACXW6R_14415 [Candidatus Binatia bacterium]